jgi:hypothetical protein
VSAIETEINAPELCEIVNGLKRWMDTTPLEPPDMEPGDWSRVRAVTVCRMREPDLPTDAPGATPNRWRLVLEADVPERPRVFFAEKSGFTGAIRFGANHRGAG